MAEARLTRSSNLEALRIVSMLMVLTVHVDGASLGLPGPVGDFSQLTDRGMWRVIVESFAIIGVNCFTLISGYFGIRLRLAGAVRFLGTAMLYSCAIYLIYCCVYPWQFSWTGLADSLRVITRTDLWYVPAYFALMILAPAINGLMDKLPTYVMPAVVIAVVGVNVAGGWIMGLEFNPTGYTVSQLVMIYMIGRWMRMGVFADIDYWQWSDRLRMMVLAIVMYVVTAMGVAYSSTMFEAPKAFAYNSPLVIVESVAFFMIFVSMRFRSRQVNMLASGAFAVYLIHKSPQVWVGWMKPTVIGLWNSLSLSQFSVVAVLLILGIYVSCAMIDVVRRRLMAYFWYMKKYRGESIEYRD
jgi:hypothetical protein